MADTSIRRVLVLFDVDDTLTAPRKPVEPLVTALLQNLQQSGLAVGIVGGSDFVKISGQLGADAVGEYDYVFAENGLVAYKAGQLLAKANLKTHLGEATLQRLINFILHYIADLHIPVKRGTFIEFRNGMLNVSPIGRNCSQDERDEFERYDAEAGVRKKMVETLRMQFADLKLHYSIGGQISFDMFPCGWDKTYCLRFVDSEFDEIHFFGDKTYKGGNDYEIYTSDKTIGHTVTSPVDTVTQCTQLFLAHIPS